MTGLAPSVSLPGGLGAEPLTFGNELLAWLLRAREDSGGGLVPGGLFSPVLAREGLTAGGPAAGEKAPFAKLGCADEAIGGNGEPGFSAGVFCPS